MKVSFPTSSDHTLIVGRTGSGKTVSALWFLSKANFHVMPWVVLNFKGDENIDAIGGAKRIGYDEIPDMEGIYMMYPRPDEIPTHLEEYLWKVFEHENIGLYVDEGFMLEKSKALDAILVQGRSKHIPVILLSQRPVWLSRFATSQSNFIQLFDLTDVRDKETILSFMPRKAQSDLPEFHSWFFDVKRKRLHHFAPVPTPDEIVDNIDERLEKLRPRRVAI